MFSKLFRKPRAPRSRWLWPASLGLAAILIIVFRLGGGSEPAAETAAPLQVTVRPAGQFVTEQAELKVVGTVESSAKTDLKSQLSGTVTALNVKIDDPVRAGQVLVRLDSRDILNQLAQAEANVAMQRSQLQAVENGVRDEELDLTLTRLDSAQQSLADAQAGLQNAQDNAALSLSNLYGQVGPFLTDAAAKADTAVSDQTDGLFTDDRTATPALTFSANNSQAEIDVRLKRVLAQQALEALQTLAAQPVGTGAAQESRLTQAQTELDTISRYLDQASLVLNSAINLPEATAASYRSQLSLARTTVNGLINGATTLAQRIGSQKQANASQLTAAQAQVTQAESAVQASQKELNLKQAGATDEQLATQQAALQQSQASAASVRTTLSKTAIVSPINGRVATVPVRQGELVNPGQLVVSVISDSGLQIKAYVTPQEAQRLTIGSPVRIEGGLPGAVTRIAPGIDPATQKIEVIITPADESADARLVDGQFVNLKLTIDVPETATGARQLTLPLTAVRAKTDGACVYTVDDAGRIAELPVEIGPIVGDRVEILSGLTADQPIIELARGLTVGRSVSVREAGVPEPDNAAPEPTSAASDQNAAPAAE
jgi:HlyD family secretion protein